MDLDAAGRASFTLAGCRDAGSPFAARAREIALGNGVEPRALIVRTLLHLPRLASYNGRLSEAQVDRELERSVAELRTDQAKVAELVPRDRFALQDLSFVEYHPDKGAAIFTHLHYLRSARPGSRTFALVDPYGMPVSLCSLSPLEWRRVGRQVEIQFRIPTERVRDVARVYSFDVAPSNAISYLLSKVRTLVRQRMPGVDLLTTAVDPNLGFSGSSYLAANWHRWMTIQARPYLYYQRSYVSPRQLLNTFQTANPVELHEKYGSAIEKSRAKLLDSMIFCCRVRGETEYLMPDEQRRLRR